MRTSYVKTKKAHPEHNLQKSFFDWLSKCHLDWRFYFFANMNAAKLTKFQGLWANQEGRLKGVWDVFCMIPIGKYHGLFIEFKVGKNTLTPEQVWFRKRAELKGYKTLVCYNIDDAMKWTEEYIYNKEEFGEEYLCERKRLDAQG